MNNNLLAGVLVLIILLVGGGYLIWSASNGGTAFVATTTPTTSSNPPSGTDTNPPAADAPTVVTDQKVAPSNSTAVVTGRVTPNGDPTSYWYDYGLTTSLGSRTASQPIGSGFSAIPSPGYITGLRANTAYYFRLSAQNALGTVNGTMYSFSTNDNPPPQGSAPGATTNAANNVARRSASLNAHVNPHGSDTTYWFEYGLDSSFGRVTSFQSAGNGTAAVAVTVPLSGLNPSSKYYYRVDAQNQYGTSVGATQSFTTSGPPAPGAPAADTTSATNVATSSATFNGRISPNGAETTYWFEYSKDSLLGHILGTVTASQTISSAAVSITVSEDSDGLSSNTKYFYRLVARNQYGTVRGDIVSFKTKP